MQDCSAGSQVCGIANMRNRKCAGLQECGITSMRDCKWARLQSVGLQVRDRKFAAYTNVLVHSAGSLVCGITSVGYQKYVIDLKGLIESSYVTESYTRFFVG